MKSLFEKDSPEWAAEAAFQTQLSCLLELLVGDSERLDEPVRAHYIVSRLIDHAIVNGQLKASWRRRAALGRTGSRRRRLNNR